MKHPHVLVIASALAVSAVLAQAAASSIGRPAHGTIGRSAPSPTAAAAIRALGLDDEGGSDDGGILVRGRVAHGTIGSARPGANAAARIRSLGLDD